MLITKFLLTNLRQNARPLYNAEPIRSVPDFLERITGVASLPAAAPTVRPAPTCVRCERAQARRVSHRRRGFDSVSLGIRRTSGQKPSVKSSVTVQKRYMRNSGGICLNSPQGMSFLPRKHGIIRPVPTLVSNDLRKFLHFGREMKTDSRLFGTKPIRAFDSVHPLDSLSSAYASVH